MKNGLVLYARLFGVWFIAVAMLFIFTMMPVIALGMYDFDHRTTWFTEFPLVWTPLSLVLAAMFSLLVCIIGLVDEGGNRFVEILIRQGKRVAIWNPVSLIVMFVRFCFVVWRSLSPVDACVEED